MGVQCEINLNKPANGVFIPGSNVTGVIKYAFDEETTITKVIVSLKGSGCLQVRNKRKKRQNRKFIYRNNETYVDIDHVIQNDEKVLPIGSYETSFSFRIPENLPPTLHYFKRIPFYNVRCIINYYVRIKFERPGMFTFNKHFRKDITMVSGITPRYPTTPTIYGEQKNLFHLFSWKESFVDIKANIQSCVITPGGKIELDYEVVNNSKVVVKGVEFKLIETYTFKPRGYVVIKANEDVIGSDSKRSTIDEGDTQKMRITINVPLEKTSIENSDMVSRDYFVQMIVVLPTPHFNATLDIPIQIGDHHKSLASRDNQYNPSVPANNPGGSADTQYNPSAPPYTPGDSADQYNPSAPPYTPGGSAENQYNPNAPLSGNRYDDPPPSYWEVMGEHNEDDEKNDDFD